MTDKTVESAPVASVTTLDKLARDMTLRDYFAGQALKWAGSAEWFSADPADAAERAYKIADALVAAGENTELFTVPSQQLVVSTKPEVTIGVTRKPIKPISRP